MGCLLPYISQQTSLRPPVFAQRAPVRLNYCHEQTSEARWHRKRTTSCASVQDLQQLAACSSKPVDLADRTVAILWDLDNVVPSSLVLDLAPAVTELKELLASWGGKVQTVALYANDVTYRRLGKTLVLQLAKCDIKLVRVQRRNQAADMQLTTDAYAFARAHGCSGCIVCVSNDKGFAPILSYINSLAVFTILVASFPSRKTLPSLLPDLHKHPVAQKCRAAISWQPAAQAAARRLQQQQQRKNVCNSNSGMHTAGITTTTTTTSSSRSRSSSRTSKRTSASTDSGWYLLHQIQCCPDPASPSGHEHPTAKSGTGDVDGSSGSEIKSDIGRECVPTTFFEAIWVRHPDG